MVSLKPAGFALWIAAVGGCVGYASAARADSPSFYRDVQGILQRSCQDCHRPGQVAPFALQTYDQARKRAADLVKVTSEHRMPPWPASTEFGGPFHDERVLPDRDIATLKDWVAGGCLEGNPAAAPPPREFAGDWPLGTPDVVLTMSAAFEVPAEGDDQFRVFVLPSEFAETRWIRAVDFKPGNRKVVHHIIAGVDTSGRARELDAADPKPGYEAVGGFGEGVPLRGFLPVWTPGSRPRYAPDGAGYVLPAGADVLIQLHYHPSGKTETDSTQIGLYLSDKPLTKQMRTGFIFPDISVVQKLKLAAKFKAAEASGKRPSFDDMLEDVLVIPPDDANYVIRGSTKAGIMGRPLGRDILLTSVMPHMHWLGKDFEMQAVLPDEKQTKVPLIRINHWDFNWQGSYALAEPIRLPKGTYFEMVAHFDNSANNPANPANPPKQVHWGEQTNDEMCIGLFDYVVADVPPANPPANPTAEPARSQPTGQ